MCGKCYQELAKTNYIEKHKKTTNKGIRQKWDKCKTKFTKFSNLEQNKIPPKMFWNICVANVIKNWLKHFKLGNTERLLTQVLDRNGTNAIRNNK